MIGLNPGFVTTQGEILSARFNESGYKVISVSASKNRYWRLADITQTLLARKREMDLVVINVYGGPSFVAEDIASFLAKSYRKPMVFVLRGGAFPDFMARFPDWTRRVLRRAQTLVAPSQYLARAVAAHGFEAKVIPNIIDISQYPYRPRQTVLPRLLWMRAFHPAYNPFMAVRVLARLRQFRPEATLCMGGQDKGMQADVERLASELGVGRAITFPGFLNMEAKFREGNHADIFLNTNRIDNMPVGIVEACAMGLPVVSTSVGGIGDLLTNEETGLLVPDDDAEAMTHAILRLLNDAELAKSLSENGRGLAEKSSWLRVRPQWETTFQEAINRAAPENEA